MAKSTYFRIAMAAELTIAVALGVSAPAPAPAPAGTEQGGQLQQITVTGYLIPRVGEGPQPVVSYDQDFIQKQANQTVSDVIRSLPYSNATLTPRSMLPSPLPLPLPLST